MPQRLPSRESSRSSSNREGEYRLIYSPQFFPSYQRHRRSSNPSTPRHTSNGYTDPPMSDRSTRRSEIRDEYSRPGSERRSRSGTSSAENVRSSGRTSFSSGGQEVYYLESRSPQSRLSETIARSSNTMSNPSSASSRRGHHGSTSSTRSSRGSGPRAYYMLPSHPTDFRFMDHGSPEVPLANYQSSHLSVSDHSGSRHSGSSGQSTHHSSRHHSRSHSRHDVEPRNSTGNRHQSDGDRR